MSYLAIAIIVVSIALAIGVLVGVIKFPKFSTRLYSSRIQRTVGSIKLSNSGSILNSIEVHVLGAATPPEWIGLTIQTGNVSTSRPITPVTLSIAEARRLSELLAEAVVT